MAQTCSSCGKWISPLIRGNGSEHVCPFCWDVVKTDSNAEVIIMRKDFGYKGESVKPVVELDTSAGLCVNCKHNTTCTFCGSSDNPKQFCEEHECMGASCSEPEPDIAVVTSEPVTTSEVITSEQDARTYLGLCVNCDNRESCCLTIPAGGIWYCEEYC